MLQSTKSIITHQNNFNIQNNPEDNILSASRFCSPSLKLGKVKSWKFIYQSPSRVERVNAEEPLSFNKQAHKLTVRKLPQFHNEITQDDPLKNSKIIENINFFREQERKKVELSESQINTNEKSKVYNGQFEISRVLVDLKMTQNPSDLRASRSLSCSYKKLENSRMSVVEGLKSSESLFQSMVKKQGSFNDSRVTQLKRNQSNVSLAESRYFSGIISR